MKQKLWILAAGLCLCMAGCGDVSETPAAGQEDIPPLTKEALIAEMIEEMAPEEKAGQLLMMDFRQNMDGSGMTVLSPEAAEAIADYHIGGVILFAENLDTAEQTQQLLSLIHI